MVFVCTSLFGLETYTHFQRLQPWLSAFSIFILIAISVLSQKVGGGQKNQSSKKTFFFFFTCQMYHVFTFKLLLHNKCFAYIPTFELLLSLYISNLKLLSSVTTPESFELRYYDPLINAHLSVFTGSFCPYRRPTFHIKYG